MRLHNYVVIISPAAGPAHLQQDDVDNKNHTFLDLFKSDVMGACNHHGMWEPAIFWSDFFQNGGLASRRNAL